MNVERGPLAAVPPSRDDAGRKLGRLELAGLEELLELRAGLELLEDAGPGHSWAP